MNYHPRPKRRLNLIGQKFNKLTVLKFAGMGVDKRFSSWKCLCDCGNIIVTKGYRLKNDGCKSCGCLNRRNLKHGITPKGKPIRFYTIWVAMKQRCFNKNAANYTRYGGRKITVCEEWLDFTRFYKDMFNSYNEHCTKFDIKDTSLDRIDNKGNYSKKNCKWSTRKEQSNNRRDTLFVTIDGIKKPFAEWCREYRVNYSTVFQRFYSHGWNIKKALKTKTRPSCSLL